MPVCEGEAALYGFRRLQRSARDRGFRVLILGDSFTVALAAAKGRSSSRGLSSVFRTVAALAFAT
eukprot:3586375-Lingulodinium_polyedra.AAC.1